MRGGQFSWDEGIARVPDIRILGQEENEVYNAALSDIAKLLYPNIPTEKDSMDRRPHLSYYLNQLEYFPEQVKSRIKEVLEIKESK